MGDGIAWLLIGGLWILNFGISWWNARAVGLVWVESKEVGGFTRFMTWMGWIMSASGFIWCYTLLMLLTAYFAQPAFVEQGEPLPITPDMLNAAFSLSYLLIIPGILFSGLMIWVDSLVQAWKRRDLASIGIAGWNTFAQVHNTYSALRGIPAAGDAVGKFFSSGDSKSKGGLVVIAIVLLAVIFGLLTTSAIVNHYAGSRPLPRQPQQAGA